jgi:hypothetical protein
MPRARLLSAAVFLAGVAPAPADVLTATDFNASGAWPQAAAIGSNKDVAAELARGPVGTIDTRGGNTPSGGLRLTVAPSPAGEPGTASLVSGPLPVRNAEADPAKLTLAFTLAASVQQPVTVRLESLDARGEPTGALETTVYPAAADFDQRFALDLAAFKPAGGAFHPTDPAVRVGFAVARNSTAGGWPTRAALDLRIDNVSYANPSYYVRPGGSDAGDGRTEATAFATPQKAIDAAKPGDIVLLMDGTYEPAGAPVARFVRPGTPAGWITLKNHPGHKPVLSAAGQHAVRVTKPADPADGPLGYIELRGLTVRGNGDTVRDKFPAEIGKSTPNTDTQGVHVNGKDGPAGMVHNVRLADCVVEYCTADGVYLDYADRIAVEGCTVRNNCWTGIAFAPAGLSVMHYANFDAADNVPKFLIAGNRVTGNKLTVPNSPWNKTPKTRFYNGNGILLDANAEKPLPDAYAGRTLVQNNVVWDNGGGGVQTWGNHRMDIVNNTLYLNGTQPERWGQIGLDMTRDVRVANNVVVAQPDGTLDTWRTGRPDRPAKIDAAPYRIDRANNLFSGGAKPPVPGANAVVADPLFVDASAGDFRLKPGSPAVRAGVWAAFVPAADAAGNPRPAGGPPDLGAFQR